MSCVYPQETVSIPCLIEVINEVRSGTITTVTIRKALKQVDTGLALFGKPSGDIVTLSADLPGLVDQLEDALVETDVTSAATPIWLVILLAILKQLLV